MLNRIKNITLEEFLIILSFLLLPYDAIRVFSTYYNPIAIFPILFLFVFKIVPIINANNKKETYIFFLFVCLGCFFSFILSYINGLPISESLEWSFTCILGFIVFITFNYVFFNVKKMKYGRIKLKSFFCKWIARAYYFPIIVTCFDVLSIYGILPSSVSKIIHSCFGGAQSLRVCGFTYEASWLVMHLLFSGTVYLYRCKNEGKKFDLLFAIAAFLCCLATISMNGLVIVCFATGIVYVYFCFKKNKLIFYLLPFAVILLIIGFFVIIRNVDADIYFINRFKNFSLSYLYYNDISIFIRITNPIIGLRMFFKNGLLGVGGGNFGFYYPEYILQDYLWVLDVYDGANEVAYTVETFSANCKSLLPRIIGETGIVSILYITVVICCLKKVFKYNGDFVLTAAVLLGCILQFDSMFFTLWLVSLALFNNMDESRKGCLYE